MNKNLFVVTFSSELKVFRVYSIIRDFTNVCQRNGLSPNTIRTIAKTKVSGEDELIEVFEVSFEALSKSHADRLSDCMDEFVNNNHLILNQEIVNYDTC